MLSRFAHTLSFLPASRRMLSLASYDRFSTLKVSSPSQFVCHVELNRPASLNAMNAKFFTELGECFNQISNDSDIRCVVLSGAGRVFSAGLDLKEASSLFASATDTQDPSRKALELYRTAIVPLQASISSLEKCLKPVICAVHSACVGGGVDLISSADIRLATNDAYFQIKEVDIGLAADIGTLQRFQKIVGNDSISRELAYTCRKLTSPEALKIGLVSATFENKDEMMQAALKMSSEIASKSPIAIVGTKKGINFSRDHSVDESLEYMATWNMAMLQSEDLIKAMMANINKEKPVFSKL